MFGAMVGGQWLKILRPSGPVRLGFHLCVLFVLGVLGDLCFWIADFKCCAPEVNWGEGVLIGSFWLNQSSRSVPSHLASRTARYEGK